MTWPMSWGCSACNPANPAIICAGWTILPVEQNLCQCGCHGSSTLNYYSYWKDTTTMAEPVITTTVVVVCRTGVTSGGDAIYTERKFRNARLHADGNGEVLVRQQDKDRPLAWGTIATFTKGYYVAAWEEGV